MISLGILPCTPSTRADLGTRLIRSVYVMKHVDILPNYSDVDHDARSSVASLDGVSIRFGVGKESGSGIGGHRRLPDACAPGREGGDRISMSWTATARPASLRAERVPLVRQHPIARHPLRVGHKLAACPLGMPGATRTPNLLIRSYFTPPNLRLKTLALTLAAGPLTSVEVC
jgi:hypothetical protein